MNGDDVHRRLDEGLALPRVSGVLEADFRVDVWCEDARSAAQSEGFAAADPHPISVTAPGGHTR